MSRRTHLLRVHLMCAYAYVFSLMKQNVVDSMRGELRGCGWRSKARLMPVCINAVWHLSARDTHTHDDVLRYCDTVCEHVCVEITAPVAELTAYILNYFLFLTLVPHPISFMVPAGERSRVFISISVFFFILICLYVCDLSLRQVG